MALNHWINLSSAELGARLGAAQLSDTWATFGVLRYAGAHFDVAAASALVARAPLPAEVTISNRDRLLTYTPALDTAAVHIVMRAAAAAAQVETRGARVNFEGVRQNASDVESTVRILHTLGATSCAVDVAEHTYTFTCTLRRPSGWENDAVISLTCNDPWACRLLESMRVQHLRLDCDTRAGTLMRTAAAGALGAAVRSNASLREAEIIPGQLTGDAFAAFMEPLAHAPLQTLTFSRLHIVPDGAYTGGRALMKYALQNTALRLLRLSAPQLQWPDLACLIEALRANTTLARFECTHAPDAPWSALPCGTVPWEAALEHRVAVDLRGTPVHTLQPLFEALSGNTTLKSLALDISSRAQMEECLVRSAAALTRNTTLEQLMASSQTSIRDPFIIYNGYSTIDTRGAVGTPMFDAHAAFRAMLRVNLTLRDAPFVFVSEHFMTLTPLEQAAYNRGGHVHRELDARYRIPRIRALLRLRTLCLAQRARIAAQSHVAAWLCESAPLWVFVAVCRMLQEPPLRANRIPY